LFVFCCVLSPGNLRAAVPSRAGRKDCKFIIYGCKSSTINPAYCAVDGPPCSAWEPDRPLASSSFLYFRWLSRFPSIDIQQSTVDGRSKSELLPVHSSSHAVRRILAFNHKRRPSVVLKKKSPRIQPCRYLYAHVTKALVVQPATTITAT
jgi:hypothetical protein